MLWVWGEPENQKPIRISGRVPQRIRTVPAEKYGRCEATEAMAAYLRHLEKAAARTKKWRQAKVNKDYVP